VDVPGGAGGGFAELEAEIAEFGGGVGEQAGDLRLKSTSVDDLPQRGVGGQREQIACYVEGTGLEGALVGVGLESFGARHAVAQGFENGGGGGLVGGEEFLSRAVLSRNRVRNQGNTIRI
jgi:hypothetical protein